jgi:hypothetical protein
MTGQGRQKDNHRPGMPLPVCAPDSSDQPHPGLSIGPRTGMIDMGVLPDLVHLTVLKRRFGSSFAELPLAGRSVR